MFCLDTMDNWDEKKLEEVVNKKHGEAEKKKAKTQIVSLLGGWIIKTGQRLMVDKEHLFSKKLWGTQISCFPVLTKESSGRANKSFPTHVNEMREECRSQEDDEETGGETRSKGNKVYKGFHGLGLGCSVCVYSSPNIWTHITQT